MSIRKLNEVLENKQDNYIYPFLWLNGEDSNTIKSCIEEIYSAGIRGLCIESRTHPDFMGSEWWNDMDLIMGEARAKKMKVFLLDDVRFPTGYANGRILSDKPNLIKKFLKISQLDFVGPFKDASFLLGWANERNKNSLKKQVQKPDKIVLVVAAKKTGSNSIDPATLVNISSLEKDGILNWDIPEGQWRIFTLIETIYGGEKQTEGYLNPLDKNATQVLIDEVYEPHFQRYKKDFGETFAGFFSDEPRFGNMHGSTGSIGRYEMVFPWNENLLNYFSEKELLKLPLLLPLEAKGEEFGIRYKYMDIVSKLYAECFTDTLASWCRERKVEYIGHLIEDNNAHSRLGYGAGHYFRALWGQDMAGIDVVLNQILPGMDKNYFKSITSSGWDGEFFHYGLAKLGSSLGHLDKKKKNRTVCEVYGAYGWAEGLKLMKWITDHMLVRGITHFVPHAFSMKKFPDADCPPHFYARGENPQNRYINVLFEYLNRVSHLLNGGKHIASVGVLYHAESEWLGEYMLFQEPARELLQNQIDFDIMSIELVCNSKVREKKFLIDDESFEALVVPYSEGIPQQFLDKVDELAKHGIPVVFINGFPKYNEMGLQISQKKFSINCTTIKLNQIAQFLRGSGIFDLEVEEYQPYLRFYHYEQPDGNIYMFFNEDPYKRIETTVKLSTSKRVLAYDGFKNTLKNIPQNIVDGKTTVDLKLEPYESIIFIEDNGSTLNKKFEAVTTVSPQIGKWKVSFASAKSYPHFTNSMELLELGNIAKIEGLQNFSGTVRYETTFDCVDEKIESIDLGSVYEIAEVILNGERLGVSIAPPYTYSIEKKLKRKGNELVIEVTNNLGKQEQDYLSQFMIQEPSGLLGPITLKKNLDDCKM
ncbi:MULTISPECIES: glycosylhydrolase-like jelly roll fold domain-containing protein [Enterococcus]|uniref:Glycoside hydrolase family 2 n=1 Tax=Enterococcus durans TaxID=53345 RepID=A0A367CG12_9ENTE|nr:MULTISPECIES: glycosylhydrolase-like jelly roll fold domain-containing protein [Enterococcus]MDB1678628.1 glycosyl hydrolase [Enterococcus durans]RCA11557.1 hypothetical protein EA71_02322 [Enterococcus durans]